MYKHRVPAQNRREIRVMMNMRFPAKNRGGKKTVDIWHFYSKELHLKGKFICNKRRFESITHKIYSRQLLKHGTWVIYCFTHDNWNVGYNIIIWQVLE